jgi:hypothetical protein
MTCAWKAAVVCCIIALALASFWAKLSAFVAVHSSRVQNSIDWILPNFAKCPRGSLQLLLANPQPSYTDGMKSPWCNEWKWWSFLGLISPRRSVGHYVPTQPKSLRMIVRVFYLRSVLGAPMSFIVKMHHFWWPLLACWQQKISPSLTVEFYVALVHFGFAPANLHIIITDCCTSIPPALCSPFHLNHELPKKQL